MKLQFSATKLVLALALTAVIIGFSAFSQKDKRDRYSFRKETNTTDDDTATPRKRDKYLTDKDMDKLDAAMKHLDEEMEKLDERLNKIDMAEIDRDVNNALKKADLEKIHERLAESLKKMDMEKMNNHIKGAMASIDKEKINAHLERAKAEIEREWQFNLNEGEIKARINNSMKHAKESIAKAKEEFKNIQNFTDALQKDGLIDKNKNYKIEVKSGELYIDGIKQTKEVSDKYRKYYRKENFTIDTNEKNEVRV